MTKLIFSGFGGQGVLLMGYVTALAAMRQGYNVTFLPAYGAEIRGGTANCTVVIADDEIASPVASSPDVVVVMNNPSLARFSSIVKPGGVVFINSSLVHAEMKRTDIKEIRLPVNSLALEIRAERSANMVMLGALAQSSQIVALDDLKQALGETGLAKKEGILKLNHRALEVGAECVRYAQK